MKKSTIIAILILIAGLLLITLGLASLRGNWAKLNGKKTSGRYVGRTYTCSGMITSLSGTESYEGIKIQTGNVSTPVIEYWYDERHEDSMKFSEEGGKLTFEREKESFNIDINFGFNNQDTTTVITLPKDFDGELEAKCTSGSVRLEGVKTKENITLKSSSGSVKAENAECKDFFAKATSVSIKLVNINASGNLDAHNNSGSISAEDLDVSGSVTLGNTSGSLRANNVECADLSAENTSGGIRLSDVEAGDSVETKTTSGSIKLEKVAASSIKSSNSSGGISIDDIKADTIDLRATSGSIHGDIDGKESDYSIVSSTTSGSNNLNGSRSGSKTLDVHTHSGSIRITFNK